MGKRGPKPQSALQMVKGGAQEAQRPEPFEEMTDAAKEVWNVVVADLPPEHFKSFHLHLLKAYCEMCVRFDAALQDIQDNGSFIEQKNGIRKRNVACQDLNDAQNAMRGLATKLGITNNSANKANQGTGKAEKPNSKRVLFGGQ